MKITLYVRTYLIKDAPVALSLVSFPIHQKHTYTRNGKVCDAASREMKVTVPDGAVIDGDQKLLCWVGDEGRVKSTVNEVYDLVQEHASGFGTASWSRAVARPDISF